LLWVVFSTVATFRCDVTHFLAKHCTDTIYQRLCKSAIKFRQAEITITYIINSIIDKNGTSQLRTKQTATVLMYHKDIRLINSSAEIHIVSKITVNT